MTIAINGMEVPYDKFISDIARKMVSIMKEEEAAPEFVSQREASRIFGRANVERWRKAGLVEPIKRPGKLEYRYTDLRNQLEAQQDYGQENQTSTADFSKLP